MSEHYDEQEAPESPPRRAFTRREVEAGAIQAGDRLVVVSTTVGSSARPGTHDAGRVAMLEPGTLVLAASASGRLAADVELAPLPDPTAYSSFGDYMEDERDPYRAAYVLVEVPELRSSVRVWVGLAYVERAP